MPAQSSRGCPSANELLPGWPAGYELVASLRFISDERDVSEFDTEEMELTWDGLPAKFDADLCCVTRLEFCSRFCDGYTADFVLAKATVSARHDAVHKDPWVPPQVGGFVGAQEHGKPKVAFPQQRLDRADSWGPVAADRPNQNDAWLNQPFKAEPGQTWCILREFAPPHN